MSDKELANALIHQLANRHNRHAAPVTNAHPHRVNVWANPNIDQHPAAIVTVTDGRFSWGWNWQHESDGDPAEVADLIEESIQSPETTVLPGGSRVVVLWGRWQDRVGTLVGYQQDYPIVDLDAAGRSGARRVRVLAVRAPLGAEDNIRR